MKYPKDSYIVRNGEKRKVLEVLGDLRFVSQIEGYTEDWERRATNAPYHISVLEREGWKVDEEKCKSEDKEPYWFIVVGDGCKVEDEKWIPEKGKRYWYLTEKGFASSHVWANDIVDNELYVFGNCFPSSDCPEILEAQRKFKEIFKK